MAEPEETYTINKPQFDDLAEVIDDLIRQLNVELRRIAEKIADKADA